MIEIIEKIMDRIAQSVLKVVFLVIFIVGLVIKAEYLFNDSPSFVMADAYDIIMMMLCLAFAYGVYKEREWLQKHINYKICFWVFISCAVLYIVLVPLTPFSDMQAVYEGALNFARFQWDKFLQDDYWNIFPGNIRLAVFWGVLLIPLPKTLVTVKIVNSVLIYFCTALTRLLAKEYGVKYYNIVYIFLLGFSPLFLYINHIYYDIPVIVLCTLALYLFKKTDNIILVAVVLGFARYFRKNVTIFLVAIIFVYVFEKAKHISSQICKKCIVQIVLSITFFFVLSKGASAIVNNMFIRDNFQSYPSWNQIYIGLNEEKFGFMDQDFSYERSAQDVIERIKEYGPIRMTKILVKKTFWLWSQGTYQAQRYAFGNDVENWEEKFEYETLVTDCLLRDEQALRQMINSFMRAQYFVLFGLMLIMFFKMKNVDKFRLFYYIIIATFLAMLIYELKSRYILPLLPIMVIMAGESFTVIEPRERIEDVVS